MKKLIGILVVLPAACGFMPAGQTGAPLKLVQTIDMPAAVKGHLDHFGVDLHGNRFFSTAEDFKSVLVFDLRTGKLIHIMENISRPHAVLYREDLDRIYVTDGGDGDLKILDGKSYALLKSVKLLLDADSLGYDRATKQLFIDTGGGDVHESYSMISVVDTTRGETLADIKVDGDTLEALALEKSTSRMYVNNRAKNQSEVIDRASRTILASWPVMLGKFNVALALDESSHRLFVGCRSGHLVVMDAQTGTELEALPIDKGVDDVAFDPASKRVDAACGSGPDSAHVFHEADADHFDFLGQVASGPLGRTARLVTELNRYFIAVSAHDATPGQVLVYAVQ